MDIRHLLYYPLLGICLCANLLTVQASEQETSRYIEEAYRQFFKTYLIEGKLMTLRMPFAEEGERELLADTGWQRALHGKGDAASLWALVDTVLLSTDFLKYKAALNEGRQKAIVFDMSTGTWAETRDLFLLGQLRSGRFVQTPHKPTVLLDGQGLKQADVYNYLYCMGLVGIDCSGFVWQCLSYTASQAGLSLSEEFKRILGAPSGDAAAYYVGTSFYNSSSRSLETVEPLVKNLRPGDILLFPGADGTMIHSAIIQSLDLGAKTIRYYQSTDEAPSEERGVHESLIYFTSPEQSLLDPRLNWTQKREPPFQGEYNSGFATDGARFRAYGGGKVVRLRLLETLVF